MLVFGTKMFSLQSHINSNAGTVKVFVRFIEFPEEWDYAIICIRIACQETGGRPAFV